MFGVSKMMRPVASVVLRRPMGTGLSHKPAAQRTFYESYMSDKATWPIIVIISGALTMATVVGIRCIMTNPDVRVGKTKRSQIIRDWS